MIPTIPDSVLAREITELVRDTESELLFRHSSRVYLFGALAGQHRGLRFDAELLYAGAMFHDMGLTRKHSSAHERFEVDGANAAREFLARHRISPAGHRHRLDGHRAPHDARHSAAHAPCGRPRDRRRGNGRARSHLRRIHDAEREAVVRAYPRTPGFKEDIIQTFYEGIRHKPETTFGNVKADVLADKDPHFVRGNFCRIIRGSAWAG